MGRGPPYERVEGVWGNREVPPPRVLRRGLVGETWFPPRERAGGERRSRRDRRRRRFGRGRGRRLGRLLDEDADRDRDRRADVRLLAGVRDLTEHDSVLGRIDRVRLLDGDLEAGRPEGRGRRVLVETSDVRDRGGRRPPGDLERDGRSLRLGRVRGRVLAG